MSAATGTGCGAKWKVCPLHGDTLRRDDDGDWRCAIRDCRTRFAQDGPCEATSAHTLLDGAGNSLPICVGHAIAAAGNDALRIEPPVPPLVLAVLRLTGRL